MDKTYSELRKEKMKRLKPAADKFFNEVLRPLLEAQVEGVKDE